MSEQSKSTTTQADELLLTQGLVPEQLIQAVKEQLETVQPKSKLVIKEYRPETPAKSIHKPSKYKPLRFIQTYPSPRTSPPGFKFYETKPSFKVASQSKSKQGVLIQSRFDLKTTHITNYSKESAKAKKKDLVFKPFVHQDPSS